MDAHRDAARACGPALLLARAVVLAGVVVGFGTLAHVTAAGRMPGPVFLGVVALLTVVFCARALTRPAGTRRVVLLTVGGQTWIHLALTAAAGHAGDPVVAPRHRAHAVDTAAATPRPGSYFEVYEAARPAAPTDGAPTLPAPFVHLAAELSGDQAPMMLLHVAAAALVGLWLAGGERALWTLLNALRGVRPVAGVRLHPVPRAPRAVPVHVLLPRPGRPLARPALRRGPPALAA